MNRILFVDDEPHILKGIERTLRGFQSGWEAEFATNGSQALAVMKERPVDVLVTDIRMPGMRGDALIERVQDLYPRTVPLALSGQCSREQALTISRRGVRFLAKPCDGTELITAITEAFVYHERIIQAPLVPENHGAFDDELRQAVLMLTAAVVKGGLLDPAAIPATLRSRFFESVDPGVVGLPEERSNNAIAASSLDPELDDLRIRLGVVVNE